MNNINNNNNSNNINDNSINNNNSNNNNNNNNFIYSHIKNIYNNKLEKRRKITN